MQETKAGWYPNVKPFTSREEDEASKSLKEMNGRKELGNTMGKSDSMQKRVEMDLFKGGMK
jgi:hypothetical protein